MTEQHPLGDKPWIKVEIVLHEGGDDDDLPSKVALAIATALGKSRSVQLQLRGELSSPEEVADKIVVTITNGGKPSVHVRQLSKGSRLIAKTATSVQRNVRGVIENAVKKIFPEIDDMTFVFAHREQRVPRKRAPSPRLPGQRRPAPSQYPDPR